MQNTASGAASHAFGVGNVASGERSTALGNWTVASGGYSSAFGFQSQALNFGSTAIGYMAVADRDYAVSVGAAGSERQIIHLADGTQATDAVNLRQLQAGDAQTLAAANAYTDAQVASVAGAAAAGALDAAKDYADAGDAATLASANAYTDAKAAGAAAGALGAARDYADAGDAATLASARDYTDTTATRTLASANAYTDQKFAGWNDQFTQFRNDVDRRFSHMDARIDRMGAMGSAMMNMSASLAGIHTQNKLGVGVGFQGGRKAVSIGYQRAVSERAAFTIGGSSSGSDKSVGMGGGFGW
jgi:autotransporter adhesin